MNMQSSEDFSSSGYCNDQNIVKRKRTKRLGPSSSTSSSGGGGSEFNYNSSSLLISSSNNTTTSSSGISTNTDQEDEDMANCLILLAQGGGTTSPPPQSRSSRRKFEEIAVTAGEGRIGIYVYECKTCNRTFPSFQALGGHRASHKNKPKATATDLIDRKKSTTPASSPPSIQSPKSHECSICGSEFPSGQALGGHMRRHRSALSSSSVTNNTAANDDDDVDLKARNMFELDLNLPVPPEENGGGNGGEAKFHQLHQPRHVFSTAALVDCHY